MMESSADLHRSLQPLKLFIVFIFFITLCVDSSVVYGGYCPAILEKMHACHSGNRRSLPEDAPVQDVDASQWKTNRDYLTLLEALSNNVDHQRQLDAGGQSPEYSADVASAIRDDRSFGDRFGVRYDPEFSGVPAMLLTANRRRSVDRSFPLPSINVQERSSHARTRSGTTAGWKGSPTSIDITLDEAVGKVEELLARRQLLNKWLNEVEDQLSRSVKSS